MATKEVKIIRLPTGKRKMRGLRWSNEAHWQMAEQGKVDVRLWV